MPETFSPATWADGVGGGTPITAAQLNRIEQGVETIDDRVAALEDIGIATALADLDRGDATQRLGPVTYFYPGTGGTQGDYWARTLRYGPYVGIVTMNPASGPGTSTDANYTAMITKAKASGVTVLGYVTSSYATKTAASIVTEINTWRTLYPAIDGIFIDEASNNTANLSHYQTLYNHVKSTFPAKKVVVTNPGTTTDEAFMAYTDVMMTFEGDPATYRARSGPAWERNYPARRFWHVVHTVTGQAELDEMIALSRTYRAGYVYFTTDVMPFPYGTLPNDPFWSGQVAAAINPVPPAALARSLEDFRVGTDPDYTNAFTAASTWSHANKRPVFVPETSTAYLTSAPIVLDSDARFFSTHIPSWSPEANGAVPAVVISPTTGFPSNRGLFEIAVGATSGRSTGLKGLALRGAGFGTNVHGIVMPGITNVPELGTTLEDLDISNFTGDGIRGGARVAFVRKVMVHECLGYGLNMNQPWNDSRIQWLYCFYNKAGGLNIDAHSQQTSIMQSRFERSGQPPYLPAGTTDPRWNATAPGIRIRAGAEVTFSQCDTDANNGPGLDIQVTSATPTVRPQNIQFSMCNFIRDGQGAGNVLNAASTGVVLTGFANTSGQNLPYITLSHCKVQSGPAADDGSTTATNPNRGLHLQNTEFCTIDGGEYWSANDTDYFYFGGTNDPGSTNVRPVINLPQWCSVTPVGDDPPVFLTAGMLRDNGTALQRYSGSAWVNI